MNSAALILIAMLWVTAAAMTSLHAMENGKSTTWGPIVLLTGIFGLIGYAISLASD